MRRKAIIKKAKSLYEKSIQKSPTSTAYENLAQIYSLTEKPSETFNFVKQALITFPNSAKLNQLAALSSQAIHTTDEARMYAQKSLILDSSSENVNALTANYQISKQAMLLYINPVNFIFR